MLTRKQRLERAARRRAQILKLVRAAVNEQGYPPTITELAAQTDVTPQQISQDLRRLSAEGRIQRNPRTARGISLPDDPEDTRDKLERVRELCESTVVREADGRFTDTETIWPSEILAILDE